MKFNRGDIVKYLGVLEVVSQEDSYCWVTDNDCHSEFQISTNELTLVCKYEDRKDIENDSNG